MQDSCGAELGGLLVQALCDDRAPASADRVEAVLDILQAFPERASPRATELSPQLASRFALEALKWLRQPASAGSGATCDEVHLLLAQYLWAYLGAAGLGWASPHYALSHQPGAFAAAVADAASQPQAAADEHLFVARAALQVMASTPDTAAADAGEPAPAVPAGAGPLRSRGPDWG